MRRQRRDIRAEHSFKGSGRIALRGVGYEPEAERPQDSGTTRRQSTIQNF